jgi:hypothetical protein
MAMVAIAKGYMSDSARKVSSERLLVMGELTGYRMVPQMTLLMWAHWQILRLRAIGIL